MTWHRIPKYPLADVPAKALPANAHDPPGSSVEAWLDEPRRIALRVLKGMGLHGEIDSELMPYLIDAETFATNAIGVLALEYGEGSCNSVASGFVALGAIARAAALRALAAGDMKEFRQLNRTHLQNMAMAKEFCASAAEAKGDAPAWLADDDAIDAPSEPEQAHAPDTGPLEPYDPNPPQPAITVEYNDGTVEHPEPGARYVPSLADLMGEDSET